MAAERNDGHQVAGRAKVSQAGATLGSLFSLPESLFASASGSAQEASPAAEAGENLEAGSSTGPEASTQAQERPEPAADGGGRSAGATWSEQGATCIACGIGTAAPGFQTAAEQRAHFRTDWHRFNVKRRLAKQAAVSEEDWERMVEAALEVGSLSGSGSEGEDSDAEEGAAAAGPSSSAAFGPAGPHAWFGAAEGRRFGVWRCLLAGSSGGGGRHGGEAAAAGAGMLLQQLRALRSTPQQWVFIMLTGGHFAAAVFRRLPPGAATAGGGARPAGSSGSHHASPLEGFEAVDHKTFHRYVVRAKAGGKQSSQDATGKFAKSAGAALRRYNEQALERDIQELLASWRHHLAAADLVFMHAPGSNAKAVFAGGQQHAPLQQGDPRIRRLPFPTRRPTYSEVQRCLRLLCQVADGSIQAHPDAALAAAEASGSGGGAGSGEQAAALVGGLSLSEAAAAQKQPAAAARTAGKLAAKGAGPPLEEEEEEEEKEETVPPSALHVAARSGQSQQVLSLLQAGADPCVRDARGRTPYQVSADKAMRDAFRRYMAQAPGQWDYAVAGIPSALTEELEAAQEAKRAEKKAKMKAREAERKQAAAETAEQRKQRAAAALDAEIAAAAAAAAAISAKASATSRAAVPSTSGGGSSAAAAAAAAAAKQKVGGRKQGPQQQQRQAAPAAAPVDPARRREQLAAAAEARIKALQQAADQQKLW